MKETIDIFTLHFEAWMHRCEAELCVVWSLRVHVVALTEDFAAALRIDTFTHHYLLLSLLWILGQTHFIVIKIIVVNDFVTKYWAKKTTWITLFNPHSILGRQVWGSKGRNLPTSQSHRARARQHQDSGLDGLIPQALTETSVVLC